MVNSFFYSHGSDMNLGLKYLRNYIPKFLSTSFPTVL